MHKALRSLVITLLVAAQLNAQVPATITPTPTPKIENPVVDFKAELPREIKVQVITQQKSWFSFEREVSEAVTEAISKSANSTQSHLSRFQAQMVTLKNSLEAELSNRNTIYVSQLGPILTSYFQTQRNILFLKGLSTGQGPKSLAEESQSTFLKLPVRSFFALFSSEDLLPSGVEYSENKEGLTGLKISPNVIWGLHLRSLGYSKKAESNTTAVYQTIAQCLLSYEIVQSYISNELMSGNLNFKLPVPNQAKICGDISAEEIFNILKSQSMDLTIRGSARNKVANFLPVYTTLIENESVKKALSQDIKVGDKTAIRAESPAYQFLYAEEFSDTELEIDGTLEDKASDTIELVTSEIGDAFNRIERTHPGLALISVFSEDADFQNKLALSIKKYIPEISESDLSQIKKDLIQAEYINTLDMWDSNWSDLPIQNLKKENYKEQIKQGIHSLKRLSLFSALNLVLTNINENEDSEEIAKQLMLDFIYDQIDQKLDSLAKTSNFQTLIDSIYQTVQSSSGALLINELQFVNNFALLNKAAEAFVLMSPETSSKEIAYSRGAILNYYSEESSAISSLAERSIRGLYDANGFEDSLITYTKIKEALENAIDQSGEGEKAYAEKSWWSTLWERETYENKKAAELKNDLMVLDQNAKRLGLHGTASERNSLFDALKDQKLSVSDQKKFIAKYKEFLLQHIFGQFRILEAPISTWQMNGQARHGSQSLYKILGNPDFSFTLKQQAMGQAFQLVRTNLKKHLTQVSEIKRVEDLRDYTLYSTVLNSLLGTNSLMSYLTRKDFLNLNSEAVIASTQFVFPALIEEHLRLKKMWKIEEFTRTESWDMINTSLLIAVTPLTIGWLSRLTFQFLPKELGGRVIPGSIRLISDRLSGRLAIYWDFIFAAIIVDMGVAGYQLYNTYSKEERLTSLSFTDWAARPLMRHDSFLNEQMQNKAERKAQYFRLGQDIFWFSFPFTTGLVADKLITPWQRLRLIKNHKKLKKLQRENSPQLIEAEGKIQSQIHKKVDRVSKWLTFDFKALGVEFGEMRPTVLKAALAKMRYSGSRSQKIRAEEAYRRIIRETTHAVAPYARSQRQFELAINVTVRDSKEFALLRSEYYRLFPRHGESNEKK